MSAPTEHDDNCDIEFQEMAALPPPPVQDGHYDEPEQADKQIRRRTRKRQIIELSHPNRPKLIEAGLNKAESVLKRLHETTGLEYAVVTHDNAVLGNPALHFSSPNLAPLVQSWIPEGGLQSAVHASILWSKHNQALANGLKLAREVNLNTDPANFSTLDLKKQSAIVKAVLNVVIKNRRKVAPWNTTTTDTLRNLSHSGTGRSYSWFPPHVQYQNPEDMAAEDLKEVFEAGVRSQGGLGQDTITDLISNVANKCSRSKSFEDTSSSGIELIIYELVEAVARSHPETGTILADGLDHALLGVEPREEDLDRIIEESLNDCNILEELRSVMNDNNTSQPPYTLAGLLLMDIALTTTVVEGKTRHKGKRYFETLLISDFRIGVLAVGVLPGTGKHQELGAKPLSDLFNSLPQAMRACPEILKLVPELGRTSAPKRNAMSRFSKVVARAVTQLHHTAAAALARETAKLSACLEEPTELENHDMAELHKVICNDLKVEAYDQGGHQIYSVNVGTEHPSLPTMSSGMFQSVVLSLKMPGLDNAGPSYAVVSKVAAGQDNNPIIAYNPDVAGARMVAKALKLHMEEMLKRYQCNTSITFAKQVNVYGPQVFGLICQHAMISAKPALLLWQHSVMQTKL
eukprot:scaffold74803_cov20-Prasinocladus_malaysianus.AAC.1